MKHPPLDTDEPSLPIMPQAPIWVTLVNDQWEQRLASDIEEIAEQLYQQCVAENYFCDIITQISPRGTRNTVYTDGPHLWYYQCGGGLAT